MRDSAVIGGCYGELRQVLYDMYGGRSYTASKRVEIFHRAISQPSNSFGKQLRHRQGQTVERGNIMRCEIWGKDATS